MKILNSLFVVFSLATLTSCSNSTPAYLTPFRPVEKLQDSVQSFEPKVDILFVVDDSGSMATHQTRFGQNIDKFTSVFLKSSVLEYNVGVITTTYDSTYYGTINCCGRLVGTTRIVTKKTPNGNRVLAENLLVGIYGDGTEKMFDPTYLALTEPTLSTYNAGFYRPEASLVTIFISDAEDQSEIISSELLFKHMLNLKSGDKTKVLSYGAIVPSSDPGTNCSRDENNVLPTKLESFLMMFKNRNSNIMNLCDSDFGTRLAGLATDIIENTGRVILLNRPPDVSSIAVTYGDADLPHDSEMGWIFDPARNSIVLGKKIQWEAQPEGSKIKVYYNAAQYEVLSR